VTDPLEEAAFDLAHARAVLEHIPDRRHALERMISAVRPGGWLMLEAIDFGGVMAAAVAHYVDPPEHAPLYERTVRAIAAVSLDYTDPGPDAIVSAVLGSTRPGSIVSLHLGHSGTVTALPAILRGLASRELRPVTLTDLLSP
jgi:SAM-dependent methyltransferase